MTKELDMGYFNLDQISCRLFLAYNQDIATIEMGF